MTRYLFQIAFDAADDNAAYELTVPWAQHIADGAVEADCLMMRADTGAVMFGRIAPDA